MGILMFTARIHDLIHQKSSVEYRLTKLTRKLRDLQNYAANIASGGMTIGNLLNSPGSMMGRTLGYLAFAHNSSIFYMEQNAPGVENMWGQQMQQMTPEAQAQMSEYIRRQLYQQGRDRALQIETRNLKVEEESMTREKDKLEALGKSIEAELKSAKEGRDAGIRDMAPKYTFNG